MKVAVTFFAQKSKFKNNSFIHIYDNVNIKNSEIVIVLIICIFFAINSSNLIFLGSNIQKVEPLEISKEQIISLNLMANIKNYRFSEIVVEEEEVITEDKKAMDDIANEYNEITVFNNVTKSDIQVIAENNTYQRLNVYGVEIVNYSTNRNIDFSRILNSQDKFFSKSTDEVFLYTTHTSESYANSKGYTFEYTSPRRTTDGKYNMLSIESELASNLNNKGINTIYSLTPHDYGEYNSAYVNSRMTFESIIAQNPNVTISIDVHRDAIENLEFAPKVEFRGYEVAGLMLVMGIGYDGEINPYYEENLKLALEIQILANKIYPGLFRSMIIRNSVYNQDLKNNSFLVEVGASGNTIEEAKLATRCLANLLNILYKD